MIKSGKLVTITVMDSNDQRGSLNVLVIPLIVISILMVGAIGFGVWAYMGRQDYKNNTDLKIEAAQAETKEAVSKEKDKEFEAKLKQPYDDYLSPAAYGTVNIKYPKTWSAYVSEEKGIPVDGYFHPNVVPGVMTNANYAARVQVTKMTYDQELKKFQQYIKNGKVKATAYQASKVPGVNGQRLDGEIAVGKRGVMVMLPLRDKTLKIWTEATQFTPDLETVILANLTFVP